MHSGLRDPADDWVNVDCLSRVLDGQRCNRTTLLDVHTLNRYGERLRPSTFIKDIGRWLRCDNCGEKGHVDLRIRWGGQS